MENLEDLATATLMNIDLRVSELIDTSSMTWNRQKLRALFFPRDEHIIMQQIPMANVKNEFVWYVTKTMGLFGENSETSIRMKMGSLFDEAEALQSTNPIVEKVWKLITAPNIKNFIWKALKGTMAISDRLRSRGMRV